MRLLVLAGLLGALVTVAPASAETLPGFRSPSGNTRCFVTCVARSGHGLFLSRERWRVW